MKTVLISLLLLVSVSALSYDAVVAAGSVSVTAGLLTGADSASHDSGNWGTVDDDSYYDNYDQRECDRGYRAGESKGASDRNFGAFYDDYTPFGGVYESCYERGYRTAFYYVMPIATPPSHGHHGNECIEYDSRIGKCLRYGWQSVDGYIYH
ncbi:MAG: hypothetical protein KAG61_08675 [Bacteriovoracaceae bacterium]|nr:hypothetical protein [Bacteriovoracaceae bacterium]